jgi:DNA-binding SARP family transcriptional activator
MLATGEGLVSMDFRILGAVTVMSSGRPVALRGTRERKLLALLLINANHVVTADRLIDGLWEQPPITARQQLHQVMFEVPPRDRTP